MTLFGLIGFTTPWLLLGLLALPILWIILRAVPPAPIRRMFPGVVLLLGLKDEEQVTDRTPWWLLLLRMLAVAAVIVGLAGPVLNPDNDNEAAGDGPALPLHHFAVHVCRAPRAACRSTLIVPQWAPGYARRPTQQLELCADTGRGPV